MHFASVHVEKVTRRRKDKERYSERHQQIKAAGSRCMNKFHKKLGILKPEKHTEVDCQSRNKKEYP